MSSSINTSQTKSSTVAPAPLQSLTARPFGDTETETEDHGTADLQTQLSHAALFGHGLSAAQPIQRQGEPDTELDEEEETPIQAKLSIGQPNDKYEQEADQVAAKVMRMPERELEEEDNTLQAKPDIQAKEDALAVPENFESQLGHHKGGGRPLSDETRAYMEPRFGADFSNVRVHEAPTLASGIQAKAFTHGQDIYFNSGKYNPGSSSGKELLAHELTHTIQQTGGIKSKLEDKEQAPIDKVNTDFPVQRLCSECGEKRERIQAKEFPGARTESVDNKVESPSSGLSNETSTSDENLSDAKGETEDSQKNKSQEDSDRTQNVEIASPDHGAKLEEANSEDISESNADLLSKVVNPKGSVEEIQSPVETDTEEDTGSVQDGEENTSTQVDASVPEAQALEKVQSEEGTENLDPAGKADAAGPETVAEKEESVTEAAGTQNELQAMGTEVTELAGNGISFALPELPSPVNESNSTDANPLNESVDVNAAIAIQSQANNMANSFLTNAVGQIQSVTGLAQIIPGRIRATSESAKASIMAAIEQQKAAVNAQIAQQRTQANAKAQAAISHIEGQYQTTTTAITQNTATAREQIEAEYTKASQLIDERESSQLPRLDELYLQAFDKYRAAGTKIGDEAQNRANQKADEYQSKVRDPKVDDDFWDGPLTDNRNEARANAAREVGKQYREALIEEASKQADASQNGKPKDIDLIHQIATQSRETLQNQRQQYLAGLANAEQQALAQAQEAKASLINTVNQSLNATLQSLDQQEVAQRQLISGYGQRQIFAIDRDAEKAITSLQAGVHEATSRLQAFLQDFQAQAQTMEAPEPEALSMVLAEMQGQLNASIAAVHMQTEQGVAASEQGILQGGQQAATAVNTLGQGGVDEAIAAGQGLNTTLSNLTQSATDTFSQIQTTYQSTASESTNTAIAGFQQVTKGIKTAFDRINQNLENGFSQSAVQLEEGLRGALNELDTKIHEEAEKAAGEVEPRWKTVLKVILVIVVIIVVAVVVGPAVIGAVGAAAGALGASAAAASWIGAVVGGAIVGAAAGAVIQMGNNLIDGKDLLHDVGKAAIIGAIGGALGGAGGMIGNTLANAGKLGIGMTQSVLKFGIDTAFDIVGGVLGDLSVGNPLTLEGILVGAAIGAAVSVSTSNLGSFGKLGKKVEGIQTNFSNKGAKFGDAVGTRVGQAVGIKPNRPHVDVPGVRSPEMGVKSPETEVEVPKTEGISSESQVRPPETGPGSAESSTKLPETDTPSGRRSHSDEPEIEPGVVAKTTTTDGHEIKVLKDGRIVRCSDCGEIKNQYKELLDSRSELKQELETIEAIPNSEQKAAKAKGFEEKLQKIQGKRKVGTDTTENEPNEISPSTTENGEPQSKRQRREAAKKAEESFVKSGDSLAKQRGYGGAPSDYNWKNQNGEPVLSRNPNKADQLLELRPDPKNPQKFIPVKSPPKDYEWVSQGNGKFTLKPQSNDLPPIEYDLKQEAFINKNTKQIYVPPSAKGSWAEHKWGNSSFAPCFPPGTIVKTPEGERKIEDLVVGDLVIAYDFESNTSVIQPILHLYKNWTQNLVDVNVNREVITSTRMHPYWVENLNQWVPASEIEPGMSLQTATGNSVKVEFTKVYTSESTTYNLTVSQAHNYYVGHLGVLVHNGNEDEKSSNFANTTKKAAKIYEIVDSSSGKEVIIYRGKTTQKTVEFRFKQHLADDASKKGDWQQKYREGELSIREIASGNWTDYETAVWEKHYIDEGLAKGYPLVNDLKAHPISEQKYNEYKHLHSPCP